MRIMWKRERQHGGGERGGVHRSPLYVGIDQRSKIKRSKAGVDTEWISQLSSRSLPTLKCFVRDKEIGGNNLILELWRMKEVENQLRQRMEFDNQQSTKSPEIYMNIKHIMN